MFPDLSSPYFWDWLCVPYIENNLVSKSDILVILAHYVMLKYADFRCIGDGDYKILRKDKDKSEALPDDWPAFGKKYVLRYVLNGQLYLLYVFISDNFLLLNLLDVENLKTSSIALEPENVVKTLEGNMNDLIPDSVKIIERLRTELIDPVLGGFTCEAHSQTDVNDY